MAKTTQYELTGKREVAYTDRDGRLVRLCRGQVLTEAEYKKLPKQLKAFFTALSDGTGDSK